MPNNENMMKKYCHPGKNRLIVHSSMRRFLKCRVCLLFAELVHNRHPPVFTKRQRGNTWTERALFAFVFIDAHQTRHV